MASLTFYRRCFLNRRGHHDGAFILADVHPESYVSDGHPALDVCAHVTIADCSRVVSLDFDVHTMAEANNALHKARILRRVINEFVDALERAIADRE
jgi:hypothetical protein